MSVPEGKGGTARTRRTPWSPVACSPPSRRKGPRPAAVPAPGAPYLPRSSMPLRSVVAERSDHCDSPHTSLPLARVLIHQPPLVRIREPHGKLHSELVISLGRNAHAAPISFRAGSNTLTLSRPFSVATQRSCWSCLPSSAVPRKRARRPQDRVYGQCLPRLWPVRHAMQGLRSRGDRQGKQARSPLRRPHAEGPPTFLNGHERTEHTRHIEYRHLYRAAHERTQLQHSAPIANS